MTLPCLPLLPSVVVVVGVGEEHRYIEAGKQEVEGRHENCISSNGPTARPALLDYSGKYGAYLPTSRVYLCSDSVQGK